MTKSLTKSHTKPAIVRLSDGMILVAEQWGAKTEDVLAGGATKLSLAEILSRFSQSKPVDDLRLIGEIDGPSRIVIEGEVCGIHLQLHIADPRGLGRYRLFAQHGWFYGIFETKQFTEICVIIDGVSVPMDLEGLR